MLGANGVEKIVEIEFDASEKEMFAKSVAAVPRLSAPCPRRTTSRPPNQATANAAQMSNLGSAVRKPLPRITAAVTPMAYVSPGHSQELGAISVVAANRVPEPRHEKEESLYTTLKAAPSRSAASAVNTASSSWALLF